MHWVLRWLSTRPLWFLHALGGALGWLAYAASPSYRRRLRDNARQAGVSDADRRASVAEAGRLVMELPRLWLRAPQRAIEDPVRWEGAELIESLLGHERGLILLTPHMGSFEMAAQGYAERFGAVHPITVLYRPARKAWLRDIEATARARPHLAGRSPHWSRRPALGRPRSHRLHKSFFADAEAGSRAREIGGRRAQGCAQAIL